MTRDVDYGHSWVLPSGCRARLSWNADTGVLYLAHPTLGDAALVAVPSREGVEDLLSGWGERFGDLAWLERRLQLVGATVPDWARR